MPICLFSGGYFVYPSDNFKNRSCGVLIWFIFYSLLNQEARRAAEKAYDVPRVDERVNKAVAAANKAANAARVAAVKAVQKRTSNNNNGDIPIPIVWFSFLSIRQSEPLSRMIIMSCDESKRKQRANLMKVFGSFLLFFFFFHLRGIFILPLLRWCKHGCLLGTAFSWWKRCWLGSRLASPLLHVYVHKNEPCYEGWHWCFFSLVLLPGEEL